MIPPHVTEEIRRLCDELIGPRPKGRYLDDWRPESVVRWNALRFYLHQKVQGHQLLRPRRDIGYRYIYPVIAELAQGWLATERASQQSAEQEAEKERRRNGPGYIYFIQAENGLVKIGRSHDTEARLRDLQTASPVKLILVHQFACDRPIAVERRYHRRFASKRVSGEWFTLTEDDLKAIKTEAAP